jgi:AraC-like DNA-binding protein
VADLVRASALRGFESLVRDLGGDPVPLLAQARLAPERLADPEAFISYGAIGRTLERAARELACPDFGRRLGRRQGVEVLGPVALVGRHARSAEEAVRQMARYFHVYTSALRADLVDIGNGRYRYVLDVRAPRSPGTVQAPERSLGIALRLLEELTGSGARPLRVFLPHAPSGPVEAYVEYFGCAVSFDAGHCGFDLRAADMRCRPPMADPQVRKLVERFLDSGADRADDDLADQVRRVVVRALPTAQATVTAAATHFGVHPRTLHRRLAQIGVTFDELLDEVRSERAQHYLTSSALPVSSISRLLGYTQQSAFTRACHRWFGASPTKLRREWTERVDG